LAQPVQLAQPLSMLLSRLAHGAAQSS
jgi:hypothetical protein